MPRWRQWLALVVISGSLAGGALAAGSAARRTHTAFPRMLVTSHLADVQVAGDQTYGVAEGDHYLDAVAKLPQVASASRVGGMDVEQLAADGGLDDRFNTGTATAYVSRDPQAYRETELLRVVDGRLPAVDRNDEMAVNPEMAALMGWHVGSQPPRLRLFPNPAHTRNGVPVPAKGIPIQERIVGIVRNPSELLFAENARVPRIFLSYQFAMDHPDSTFYSLGLVHLRPGVDITSFRAAITEVAAHFPGEFVSAVSTSEGAAALNQALSPQEYALWVLGAIGLLAAAALLAQGAAANLRAALPDFQVLRSLGMSRGTRQGVSLVATAMAAVTSALLAFGIAALLSPLGPISVARTAEPHPGFAPNLALLGIGSGALIILGFVLGLAPSLRVATAAEASRQDGDADSPARLATRLGRRGASVPAVVGVGFAFRRDRGAAGLSNQAALAGVTVAVLVATGSLVFVSNLNRLTHTPHLYGWNWTAQVGSNFGTIPPPAVPRLLKMPFIDEASALTLGVARFGSKIVPGIGVSGLTDNSPYISIRSGRRPADLNEIAVGSRTLASIHSHLGATVDAVINGETRQLRIVGVATFPALGETRFQTTDLGKGVAGVAGLFPQGQHPAGRYNYLLLQLKPGGVAAVIAALARFGCTEDSCVITEGRPTDINGYARARSLGVAGIGVLAFALLIAFGRAVVTTVRRRRHDLAVLKAIGMTRRQVAAAVGWQSVAVGSAALVVGLPLGVVAGRLLWAAFANSLGVDPNAAVAVGELLLAVASVAVAALLTGTLGAVRARRTRTAYELRAG
jgi:hypothetical protein